MHQHQGVGPAGGDHRRGDHRLAEGGGRRQHAGIVPEQGVRGRLLLACQFAFEGRCERTAGIALIALTDRNSHRAEQILHRVAASARQCDVV